MMPAMDAAQIERLAELFVSWLGQATLWGSVLAIAVLVVRSAARGRIPSWWLGVLWLLVLTRLLMPSGVRVQSPVSIENLMGSPPPRVFSAPEPQGLDDAVVVWQEREGIAAPRDAVPPVVPEVAAPARGDGAVMEGVGGVPWSMVGAAVWGLGAAVMLLAIAAANVRLVRTLRSARPISDVGVIDLLERSRGEMGVRAPVAIFECAGISTPAIVGWLRPHLVLPAGLVTKLSEQQLRAVILHELAHVRRHDIAVGWLAALVIVVHWFNPMVWLAVRAVQQDRELAADEAAMARSPEAARADYGRALLAVADESLAERAIDRVLPRAPSLAAVVGPVVGRSELSRRIRMIASYQTLSVWRSCVGLVVVVCLALTGLTRATLAPGKDASLHRIYTAAYTRDASGVIQLPASARFMVQASYSGMDEHGARVTDDRLTLILADDARSFWPVISLLSDQDAAAFLESLRGAIAERTRMGGGVAPWGRGPVTAVLGTEPYEIDELGRITLPQRVRLVAMPEYLGEDDAGRAIDDPRVTIVLNDQRTPDSGFWALVARVDLPLAEKLASDLQAVMASRAQRGAGAAAGEHAAAPGPLAAMTAPQLLAHVKEMYAKVRTYRDTGVVAQVFLQEKTDDETQRRALPFSLAFERDGRFRYEFREERGMLRGDRQYVVWGDANGASTWWTLRPEVRKYESIGAALAGPTGVSGGSATLITTLLMPETEWGVRVTRLGNPAITGREVVDGAACVIVTGDLHADERTTLWIDEHSGLIRRVQSMTRVDPAAQHAPGAPAGAGAPFRVKTTITIHPVVNAMIEDAALTFTPPK